MDGDDNEKYGAMTCRKAGKYVALKAQIQDEPNKVDVGQNEENCGCPPGSTPVAYYHTHPLYDYKLGKPALRLRSRLKNS